LLISENVPGSEKSKVKNQKSKVIASLLNRIATVQVCDASKDDLCSIADYQKGSL
jgi:hypothetical protein